MHVQVLTKNQFIYKGIYNYLLVYLFISHVIIQLSPIRSKPWSPLSKVIAYAK